MRDKFSPPVNLRTGQVSARLSGVAVLRPMSDGNYIGFRTAAEAMGHPSTKVKP